LIDLTVYSDLFLMKNFGLRFPRVDT